jgi:peptidoglycan hydrolase-like protein with peptidoglycan-binding domain
VVEPTSIRRGRGHRLKFVTLGAALWLAACSSGGDHVAVLPSRVDGVTSSTTSASSTSTTTTPPASLPSTSAAPTPAAAASGLGPGARGPAVANLEQRLAALHYDVGAVDDVYDQNTAYGVTAFQKVTGMPRNGRATDDVVRALTTAQPPPPLVPAGGANRVEIDLTRQVLFLYEGGTLTKILPVSTGSGERFCSEGSCRRAVTPSGSFAVYRQDRGWEKSPLGRLYNAQYFNGGIAIHGSPSVPATPASHGCVRIPMSASEWFPSHITLGTPVYVAGPDGAPAPLPPPPPPAPPGGPAPSTAVPPMTFIPGTTAPPASTPPTTSSLLGGLLGGR